MQFKTSSKTSDKNKKGNLNGSDIETEKGKRILLSISFQTFNFIAVQWLYPNVINCIFLDIDPDRFCESPINTSFTKFNQSVQKLDLLKRRQSYSEFEELIEKKVSRMLHY